MKQNFSVTAICKFIIPSLIGIIIFMLPISINGNVTIPIAIFSNWLQTLLYGYTPAIMLVIISITFLGTLITKVWKPAFILNFPFWNSLFNVAPAWFIIRTFGFLFATVTIFQWGPEAISSENTGGLLLGKEGLLSVLFSVFLFAGLFMPLLLNFGLLDFFGALLIKIMRPLFKLPGRSSIDAIASWLGDGTIGVLLTSKQYEDGFYTKKEAAIVGTTFSIVSITFSLVVINTVHLENLFVPFYLTVTFAGLVAAIIMPRIPPLSKKPNTYYGEKEAATTEVIPPGFTPVQWGFTQAVKQADKNTSIPAFFLDGLKNVLDMWLGVAPVVMAIGTIGLMLAEYTPIFQWLGTPFIPLLELMQIPEAQAASETILIGFTDMLLPSIIASGIESDMTRFVIAALSVTQLIYLSEVGGLLLGSKIPLKFFDLVLIFLERTIITLPIIVIVAHFLF
ncbi:YjiH family protein [Caldibacillus lycopersici]|uniref:YjiH family protein n=1 Tax=Perspicuibacillus lycopersici TaxID=1325689 RepID=A0AAE3IRX7_9BACI|nr:YjiH family protein [Perspicuibacillus lycopersici]MCU9613366.1 YjiH family protein [Perspicuibacillus lycopersici]